MTVPVEVASVFDRFPASVRGAVVVRGLDSDPHQVRLERAEVVEAHATGRGVREIHMEPVSVDIVPRGEVVIPFDVPFAELDPGWYCVAADVVVDGSARIRGPEGGGKRFLVPWPTAEVRRGEVPAGVRIAVKGSRGATVEAVECKADRAVVRWRHAPGEAPEFGELKVAADGRRLPMLEGTHDPRTGGRTTVTHPVPKGARALAFEVDRYFPPDAAALRGRWSARLDLT